MAATATDDLKFPEGVQRLEWKDVQPYTGNGNGAGSVRLRDAVLGEGRFASVIRAQLRTKGLGLVDIAVKVLDQRFEEDYPLRCADALQEAGTLAELSAKMLNKDLIVRLLGVAAGPLSTELASAFNLRDGTHRVGIVLRLEAGGSLDTVLCNTDPMSKQMLTKPVLIRILRDIADGLRELHLVGGVHGDIKPQNILLSSKDVSSADNKVRLSDFGLSEIKVVRSLEGTTGNLTNK